MSSFLEEAKANYTTQLGDAGDILLDKSEDESNNNIHAQRALTQRRRRRRKKQDGTATLASSLTLLPLIAGGIILWRWWSQRRKQTGSTKGGKASAQKQSQASRSTFSFDNKKNKKSGKKGHSGNEHGLASQSPIQAIPNIKTPVPPPNMTGPGPRVSGNPKKNHKRKSAKKEVKNAAKGGKDSDALGAVIAARAKEKGITDAGKAPETGFYSVVDVEKNTDAFHNVQSWQDTGKKTYKR